MEVQPYLTAEEVKNRLKISDSELVQLMVSDQLRGYDLKFGHIVDSTFKPSQKGILGEMHDFGLNGSMHYLEYERSYIIHLVTNNKIVFWTKDVEALEKETPDYFKQVKRKIEGYGENHFVFSGDYWKVCFQNQTKAIKNVDGIRYIAHLLDHPNKKISAIELVHLVKGPVFESPQEPYRRIMEHHQLEDDGIYMQEQTIVESPRGKKLQNAIKNKAEELQDELDRAKEQGRSEEIEEAQEKYNKFMEALALQKSQDSTDISKHRINVHKRIALAISLINKAGLKSLSDYLSKHIHTGTSCEYSPDPGNPTEWNIKFESN